MHTRIRNYFVMAAGTCLLSACSTPGQHRETIDKTAYSIIEKKQVEALGKTEPFLIEPPAETLRRRLMLDQALPYSHPASLSTKDLEPVDHWPNDDYLDPESALPDQSFPGEIDLMKLKLIDVLQIAAANNRQYQSSKENVFITAIDLDLRRDQFRNTFTGGLESALSADLGGNDTVSGSENNGFLNASRRFMNGMTLSTRIGLDVVKLLNPFSESSYGLFGDTSISIPLLRGAGRHIVAEPLTQAERNAVYAIYDFEQFKRQFAVSVATNYISTLQVIDQIINAENNYRGLVTSTRLVRRLADAGKRDPVEVDQSIQQELNARNGWISSQIRYQASLDSLKYLLGLPPDAEIDLDRDELSRITESAKSVIDSGSATQIEEVVPEANAPVTLAPISYENAGPLELDEDVALQLALENRLDLRTAQGEVYDAQRRVTVAADALRAELTLLGSASYGSGRSLGSANSDGSIDPDFEKGRYNALLSLDLPLERTSEIAAYRESIISLERAVRNLQDVEDSVKLDVRSRLRDLLDARESLRIQAMAVDLAQRRVQSTTLSLRAGRVIIRDLLEAQDDLLSSQNSLTSALINYRIAELELQRDLDLLEVNEKGIWKEFSLAEWRNEHETN